MKSSLSAVRTSFTTALQALNYAVYDRQRKINDYPYIVIGEQAEQQEGDQGSFGQLSTINIEIYNAWSSDYGSRSVTDDITNAVLGKILTKPHTITITGFDMPVLVMDNIMSSTEQTPTQTMVTTVIRFKLQLFEQ